MTALASDYVTFWWITLGLGLVVASAVILLLQLLVVFVKDIDQSVTAASDDAGEVVAQTAATGKLDETVTLVTALRDETKRHADALTAMAGTGGR